MRVLILSAFLAVAAAAPQLLHPVVLQPIAVAPAVPSGDLQAAAINAQVRAEDQARAIADQARELAEQAVENQNEGIIEGTDIAKERSEEAFWAAEDQKWQAYSAAQTAEAAIGGQLSSNDAARSLAYVAGVVPGVAAPVAVAPVAQVQASEAQNAEVKDAITKSAEQQAEKQESAVEEKKEADKESVEVKSAQPEQAAAPEAPEAPKAENVDLKAFRSIVHPVPVGLPGVAPYSYQSIIPGVAYAQTGLRTALPIAPYNQPIVYNFPLHY